MLVLGMLPALGSAALIPTLAVEALSRCQSMAYSMAEMAQTAGLVW